jgi:hypothetical protein
MRKALTACLAALLVVPAVATSAQEQPSIQAGARVRVSQCHTLVLRSGALTTECARYTGTLVAIAPDALEMREDRGVKGSTVPRDSVTKLELRARGSTRTRVDVHRGTRIHPVRGAAIGFLVGGVATGIYFAIYCDPMADRDACGGSRTEAGLGYGAFGGLIGGFFGMLFGAAIRTDRWEEVPLDQLRVQPVATLDGRLGLAALLRF